MRLRGYIFADTGAWLALANEYDPHHAAAEQFISERPRLLTTNFIIDETITLVLKRVGHPAARKIGEQLWSGQRARLVYVTPADQRAAWELFKKYDDKLFSFTDCTSFVVMERLGLTHAFAFDADFAQTGQFVCVPR